jgi:hypothetical protein
MQFSSHVARSSLFIGVTIKGSYMLFNWKKGTGKEQHAEAVIVLLYTMCRCVERG